MINQTPNKLLQGKTPYEILFGRKPTYDHLKVFGCLCYAQNRTRDEDKFASRSRRCVFLRYSLGKKAWRLYDLEKNEFLDSRDVQFSKNIFPYAQQISTETSNPHHQIPSFSLCWDIEINPHTQEHLDDRGITDGAIHQQTSARSISAETQHPEQAPTTVVRGQQPNEGPSLEQQTQGISQQPPEVPSQHRREFRAQ